MLFRFIINIIFKFLHLHWHIWNVWRKFVDSIFAHLWSVSLVADGFDGQPTDYHCFLLSQTVASFAKFTDQALRVKCKDRAKKLIHLTHSIGQWTIWSSKPLVCSMSAVAEYVLSSHLTFACFPLFFTYSLEAVLITFRKSTDQAKFNIINIITALLVIFTQFHFFNWEVLK